MSAKPYLVPLQTRSESSKAEVDLSPNPAYGSAPESSKAEIGLSSNPAYGSAPGQPVVKSNEAGYYDYISPAEGEGADMAAERRRASDLVNPPASSEGKQASMPCLMVSVVAVVMLVSLLGLTIAVASLALTLNAEPNTASGESS